MRTATGETLALDGRPVGRRGLQTRQRLLDATADLLATHGVRDLRVVDIARHVGTSPATFYQYFKDVEEATLVLAEEVVDEMPRVARIIDGSWTGKGGVDTARSLVRAFVELWDEHRAVLRVRNLAAQEGDPRFREVRNRALSAITDRLAAEIAESQRAGRVSQALQPWAAAAALVAMMERMAAYHFDIEARGVAAEEMIETVAAIVYQTVSGRKAP